MGVAMNTLVSIPLGFTTRTTSAAHANQLSSRYSIGKGAIGGRSDHHTNPLNPGDLLTDLPPFPWHLKSDAAYQQAAKPPVRVHPQRCWFVPSIPPARCAAQTFSGKLGSLETTKAAHAQATNIVYGVTKTPNLQRFRKPVA